MVCWPRLASVSCPALSRSLRASGACAVQPTRRYEHVRGTAEDWDIAKAERARRALVDAPIGGRGLSHPDQIPHSLERRRADARHVLDILNPLERPVRLAVVEDFPGCHRPYPRQRLELRLRRRVDVDQ